MASASQVPPASPFGTRIQPQNVTDDVRTRLANFETKLELISVACTGAVLGFLAFGLWTFYRFYGRPRGSEFNGMVPLMIAFALIVCGIHILYQWRREIWVTWPATSAIVTHLEPTWHRFQESPEHRPALTLRYISKPNVVLDPIELALTPDARESTALVRGRYDFTQTLKNGSLVTVVYDPDNPARVLVVEMNDPGTLAT